MITRTLNALGIISVALVAASFAAIAQTAPQPGATAPGSVTGNPMAACRADMKSLCGTVERGRGARMQCLVENKAKASPECQAAMAAIQERFAGGGVNKSERRGRFAACQADLATLCPEAAKGMARAQCLRQNEAKVSPACSQALAAMPMRRHGQMDPAAAPGAVPAAPAVPAPAAPKPQ